MKDKPSDLSRGKKQKSMLDRMLDEWDLDYNGFADFLGVQRMALWRYRKGEREFRLNMEQIQKLDKLLEKLGKRFSDLPPDWYRDLDQKENNQWEKAKIKT